MKRDVIPSKYKVIDEGSPESALASGSITFMRTLSVATNSFVRGAFVEARTFLPSFVG